MNTKHIEARKGAMYCSHCEATGIIHMPAKIDDIINQMDDFRDAHMSCKPANIEAEMSEYIKGFDAGCEHMMREIQLYYKTNITSDFLPLIAHLRKGLK